MEEQDPSSSDFLKPLEVTGRAGKNKKDRWADFSPLKCLQNSPDRAPKRPVLIAVSGSPNRKSPLKLLKPSKLSFTSPIMKKARRMATHMTSGENTPVERPIVPLRSLFDSVTCQRLPIDWSLKTHIKFTSCKPFAYRGCFGFREESTGITSFARCNNGTCQANGPRSELASSSLLFSPSRKSLDCSSSSSLRQHTIVWQFPSLPWLHLYPRIGRLANTKQSKIPSLPSPAIESLQNEFKVSLKSLYHLVRTRHCAYFYLCSPNFTALFRSAGVAAALDEVHVLIYPTSTGFRKALQKEKISFSTPYAPESSKENNSSSISNEDTSTLFESEENDPSVEEDGDDDDEDANAILGSLGLSQHNFPTLKSAKLKRAKTASTVHVDDNSSLVLIFGPDLQLLVNMLCDQVTKFCVSATGPLANIPPTLLSPVAFTGGALQPLKIKMSSSAVQDGSTVHKLDIHGPILPSSLYSLCEHFRSSQDGSFVGNFAVHEQTEVFTGFNSLKFSPINAIFLQESLVSTGLTDQLVTDFCNKDSQSKCAIREIRFENNAFSIN